MVYEKNGAYRPGDAYGTFTCVRCKRRFRENPQAHRLDLRLCVSCEANSTLLNLRRIFRKEFVPWTRS